MVNNFISYRCIYRRDGVAIRVSASLSVDLVFIFPSRAFLDFKFKRVSVENKPENLLVSLSKTLNGMPPSFRGKQVAGPSSLSVVVAQSDERQANRT